MPVCLSVIESVFKPKKYGWHGETNPGNFKNISKKKWRISCNKFEFISMKNRPDYEHGISTVAYIAPPLVIHLHSVAHNVTFYPLDYWIIG